MSLASMTGYARSVSATAGASITCEIRSVNGKSLDLRLRLPPGLDALDSEIRQRAAIGLKRGSVTINLAVDQVESGNQLVLNRGALETVLAAMDELSARINVQPPTLDGILNIRGVLEPRETWLADGSDEELSAAILACVDVALSNLIATRCEEGARIADVLLGKLDEIAALVERAENHPARSRDTILAKLRQQLADLEADITIPQDRLAQEALLLATKADIREELDRLAVHITSARQLITGGGSVGRRLDFLAQEFNREANTLCSKSNAVELTAIGLDLKAAIDQLREQVQNIE